MTTQELYFQAQARIATLEAALREILKCEGRFSRDPLEHASNTIYAMAYTAQNALDGTWQEKESD